MVSVPPICKSWAWRYDSFVDIVLNKGQIDLKGCAAPRLTLNDDIALDAALRFRRLLPAQAGAIPFSFVSEEWVEHMSHCLGVHALPVSVTENMTYRSDSTSGWVRRKSSSSRTLVVSIVKFPPRGIASRAVNGEVQEHLLYLAGSRLDRPQG